jgi:hypothetical protein
MSGVLAIINADRCEYRNTERTHEVQNSKY